MCLCLHKSDTTKINRLLLPDLKFKEFFFLKLIEYWIVADLY